MDVETAIAPTACVPGIYRGLAAEAYHALDAASSHRLSLLARSPAHLRWSIDNPSGPTPAMQFGSLVHTAVLELDQLAERFAVAPKCDRRTTAGKAAWGEFCEQQAGKTIVDLDDYCRAVSVAAAVNEHPAARALLDARTETELSAVWRCRETDERCKLRADGVCLLDGMMVLLDLKTTQDASRKAFERTIWNFAYQRQAAFYSAGLCANDIPVESAVLIAVESTAPFVVSVFRLQDDVLAAAHEEVVGLLRKYRECRETGRWPGYSDQVQEISVPRWAWKDMEQVA